MDDLDLEVEDEAPETEASPLREAASVAFPGTTWDSEKLAALKELIHLCSGASYDDEDDFKPKKKAAQSNLMAVFGPSIKGRK